jgi:hypothetical protein
MGSFGISFNNVNGDMSGLNISNNMVYNTCTGLADCGAIYTQDVNATATGVQIKNNYVRDGEQYRVAIYSEYCMSNVTVSQNVIVGKNGLNSGNNDVFSGTDRPRHVWAKNDGLPNMERHGLLGGRDERQ